MDRGVSLGLGQVPRAVAVRAVIRYTADKNRRLVINSEWLPILEVLPR